MKGCPIVHLTSDPRAQEVQDPKERTNFTNVAKVKYYEHFELQAKIRSFPKYLQIRWYKGSTVLDISRLKNYESSCKGDKAVLCIKNVTKDDEDIYRVEAVNGLGEGKSNAITLKVIGGK